MMRPAATGNVAVVLECGLGEAIHSGEEWQFELGQCITHKDQSMPSLVLTRVRTSRGDEIYGLRSFAQEDPNRDRLIFGSSLVSVVPGSEPCHDCLLFRTGMCPGDLR
jgi:hypothetical protein